jgi:hypothetical protein
MGAVICYGTLLTMFFILTVMPIAYWKVMGLAETDTINACPQWPLWPLRLLRLSSDYSQRLRFDG